MHSLGHMAGPDKWKHIENNDEHFNPRGGFMATGTGQAWLLNGFRTVTCPECPSGDKTIPAPGNVKLETMKKLVLGLNQPPEVNTVKECIRIQNLFYGK